jgi:hypothetical protein
MADAIYKKSPISKTEYTKADYDALTIDELRAEGFYTDPKLVYETVEDKVKNFSGEKEYTLEAFTVDGDGNPDKKIPVGTKIHGMEEAHFNFNGVEPE